MLLGGLKVSEQEIVDQLVLLLVDSPVATENNPKADTSILKAFEMLGMHTHTYTHTILIVRLTSRLQLTCIAQREQCPNYLSSTVFLSRHSRAVRRRKTVRVSLRPVSLFLSEPSQRGERTVNDVDLVLMIRCGRVCFCWLAFCSRSHHFRALQVVPAPLIFTQLVLLYCLLNTPLLRSLSFADLSRPPV